MCHKAAMLHVYVHIICSIKLGFFKGAHVKLIAGSRDSLFGRRALEATPFEETTVALSGPRPLSSLSPSPPTSDAAPAVSSLGPPPPRSAATTPMEVNLRNHIFFSSAVAVGGFRAADLYFLFMVILKATKGAPGGGGSVEGSATGARTPGGDASEEDVGVVGDGQTKVADGGQGGVGGTAPGSRREVRFAPPMMHSSHLHFFCLFRFFGV